MFSTVSADIKVFRNCPICAKRASNMGKKNKSRSARRTGSPVGYEEDVSSEEYEITEEIYEVECVVGHRYRRNEIEYKVRWRGWSEQFDEWLHHSKMDCPDAIKEYWKSIDHTKTEESKLSEKDGGRKREHPSSKKSTPSRKSIASPPLKRACTADHEIEATASPDAAESPPTKTTPSTPHVSSSSKKKKKKDELKPHNPAFDADSQLLAGALEDSASDGDSMPALMPSTSFSTEERASPSVSVSSSTHSIPPLKIKRQIPRPPAIPKRKATPSLSNTSTSATTSATSVVASSASASGTSLGEITPSAPGSPKAGTPTHLISPDDDHKKTTDLNNETEASSSTSETTSKTVEPPVEEKRFVRPHGFERGLTVERIHGFLRRADRNFAVVQFKNCDIVEILALEIVKHYDHLALIRGFEEHHIRCRRNQVLAAGMSPPKSSES
ncbi:hypothetical protein Aduo_000159 [Ancylostoma duodenale]